MTRVFGEVADLYDDARPEYPADVRYAIGEYLGGPPARIAELGAGTGKGTDLLLKLGAPLTAIEPDPRMAAVLRTKFPQVEVVNAAFEEWTPPTGGVDLLACASAWHWLDEKTRHQRAFDALAPGGVLAIFLNRFFYDDPAQRAALDELFTRIMPGPALRQGEWPYEEVTGAGLWSDVESRTWHRYPELSKAEYLALTRTFGPFLKNPPDRQRLILDSLGSLIDDFGGSVVLNLHTRLVLARRP